MMFLSAAVGAPTTASRPATLLVDNGSKRAASTLALRAAAERLSLLTGGAVEPVSLRWSDGVAADALAGRPARTLQSALRQLAEDGVDAAAIVPLFLGPSDGLAEAVRAARADPAAPRRIAAAPCLVDTAAPADARVGRALAAAVLRLGRARGLSFPLRVVVVDHGSASRAVVAVRDRLAATVAELLGPRASVVAASMERRPGEQYAFAEPLLERVVGGAPPYDSGDVVVAMAFLQPGRHAGPGGDVEQILDAARGRSAGLRTHVTPLLGGSHLVHEVLADRTAEAHAALREPLRGNPEA